MKILTILSVATLFTTAIAAPVNQTNDETTSILAEAIISYLDFDGANDIAALPFFNSTDSGLLFVNTTIIEQAAQAAQADGVNLQKRDAHPWHWIKLAPAQPVYKRDAIADADAWHWIKLVPGQPVYKRDAIADADADAEAWHWTHLVPVEPPK